MQKVGRACAECARQGGETHSLQGPGIRGACVQGFGPKNAVVTIFWNWADVLILAAQNLNNFRFQTNIVCDESVLGKKCSEDI